MDTLARWMAHYLAEKMEKAESAPEGEERERARRECIELILKLWERRHSWPLSAPLKDIAGRLEELLHPRPKFFRRTDRESDPFLDLLRDLEQLHVNETELCITAWLGSLDLQKDRDYLNNHSDHLENEERELIQRLISLQDLMAAPDTKLGELLVTNFGKLPLLEQKNLVLKRLQLISEARKNY